VLVYESEAVPVLFSVVCMTVSQFSCPDYHLFYFSFLASVSCSPLIFSTLPMTVQDIEVAVHQTPLTLYVPPPSNLVQERWPIETSSSRVVLL
jgi:hypothetical protein